VNYRSDLAAGYGGLGDILSARGRRSEAREAQQKARALRERLVEEHPRLTRLSVELAHSYVALGRQSDTPAAAAQWYSRAAAVLEGVLQKEPHDSAARGLLEAAAAGARASPAAQPPGRSP
jgi:hypothetical protein